MLDEVMATLKDLVTLERGIRGDCNRCIEAIRETGTVTPEQTRGVIQAIRRMDEVIRRAVETLTGQKIDWGDPE